MVTLQECEFRPLSNRLHGEHFFLSGPNKSIIKINNNNNNNNSSRASAARL